MTPTDTAAPATSTAGPGPDTDTPPSPHPLQHLFDPATIRPRCAAILRSVEDNLSPSFTLDRTQLPNCAARVAQTIRRRFPDLNVPPHSRWRHFDAGGVARTAELARALAGRDRLDVARAHFDLVVPAVLLDAGAGPQWAYDESQALHRDALPEHRHDNDALLAMLDAAARNKPRAGGEALAAALEAMPAESAAAAAAVPDTSASRYRRSEGLAVATLRAFMGGAFSSDRQDPLRCDAATLKLMDAPALRALMQAGPSNPLAGLEERAAMLQRLGEVLAAEARRSGGAARPALFFDRLTGGGTQQRVSATALLRELVAVLAPIWAEGSRVQGLPAGDVWPHRWAGDALADGNRDTTTAGHLPLHKLAQWLTYSLIEPLQWAGFEVTDVGGLTALAEYRNGGLLLDTGVLVPRALPPAGRTLKPGDEWVIEWRALTVALLDELAPLVRAELGLSEAELPLASVLEGGTWAAGRELAQERRSGAPPVAVASAGTLF
jgi:hypothetical protein